MITIPMRVSVSEATLPMSIVSSEQVIRMTVSAAYNGMNAPPYEGEYEVTPRLYAQYLDTDGKLMNDDVTVYEIPVARTSNPQGGLTVLIG